MIEYFLRKCLFCFPPETAHKLVLKGIQYGLYKNKNLYSDEVLKSTHFGMEFNNPLGLAAGFDKNGICLIPLSKMGFGFIELGTVTLKPQSGNPHPRIFRLEEDQSVINRLGFNNVGADEFIHNITKQYEHRKCIVGVNIGKNMNSRIATKDYTNMLKKIYACADYIVINVSSPNTPNLRKLQRYNALKSLMQNILDARLEIDSDEKKPILIKISPDLRENERVGVLDVVSHKKIAGLIIGNTSIMRKGLISSKRVEYGGLSGKGIFGISTRILHDIYKETKGKVPLIGCGGITNALDAYEKIRNGASLLQVYTAIVYKGFTSVLQMNKQLSTILQADGFKNISEAVGVDVKL
ncbi:MAG: dihydroorotate oxidase [Candidatus Xenolissoclinum pacificiensis L6]|uniref:Dihydroorotate dehydrogenase (quinone) n=1 Tax=Candidatus Xenolissoclinum pacificiensis L6 TaxID=1401685 RepID=W2V009_9RICK|nr:MAG: dihydroorotate oxidase [Candidatus Xenolissoclinum pacificiensis L6]